MYNGCDRHGLIPLIPGGEPVVILGGAPGDGSQGLLDRPERLAGALSNKGLTMGRKTEHVKDCKGIKFIYIYILIIIHHIIYI